MLLVDYIPGQPNDRFVDDNLGSYYESFQAWPVPEQLGDAVKPLTLASEVRLKDAYGGAAKAGQTVPDVPSLLRFMAKNRNSYGVAQLAADAAPRLDLRQYHNKSLSLVVGKTFADRVMFWNQRFLAPGHLGRAIVTLVVDPGKARRRQLFRRLH